MMPRLLLSFAVCVLSLTLRAAEPGHASPAPAGLHRHWVTAESTSYEVKAPAGVRNRWVMIANDGTECVESPWVVANGRRDWFSTNDILAGILVPGMSEREKAMAIWRFLVENRYHDAPAHEDIEMHDPVRFLNVYGYGFCDDSATNFMVLAEQVGLKARIWGLSGHVVPEAFFEGGWRMLDPDGEIFYLEEDGRTIAGVKTLEERPDLIHKYPSPYYKDSSKIAAIYTSAENNKLTGDGYRRRSESVHTMAFTLRPGESLTRYQENWGLYFSSYEKARPPRNSGRTRYGNGRFAFAPIFAADVFRQGASEVSNLRTFHDGRRDVLRSETRPGVLAYRFAGPYPYLAGTVALQGRGKLALAFSEDGVRWTEFWAAEGERVDTSVPITGQLRTRVGRPVYAYHLRLSVEGEIESLRYETDVQVAPASLPVLQPGSNVIRYRDATSGTRRVRVEFAYDNGDLH